MIAPSSLVFPRDRLSLRLDAVRRAPIAMVVAGAERGKSTALRAYLAARAVTHLRLGGSPELLRALVEAFGSVAPAMPSSAPGMLAQFASGDDDGAVLGWLCEHLAGIATTVVVDELELISEPRDVALLRGLIDATVPRIRWILSGRDAAAFPVARWLAGGITELPIDDDDLRIDLDDVRAVAASAGLALDDAALTAIHASAAEAPLRLAIALAGGHTDAAESPEQLYDRLAAAELEARDRATQQRWCEVALLGRFDASLLRAIDRSADAAATIAALTSAGFVYAVDEHTHAFHEPFRERLLAQLEAMPAPRRNLSYARAAMALEARGRWSEAVALRIRARDGEAVALGLDARGFRAIDSGEMATVRAALAAIPDEVLHRHPIALAMRAIVASLDESYDVAEAWFRMAIETSTDAVRSAIVVRYGVDLVRRGRTDAVELLEAEAARVGSGDGDGFAAELWGLLGTAYVGAHRPDDARDAARRALSRLHDVADGGARARILHQAAYVALNDGDYVAAKDLAQRAYEGAEAAYLYDLAARALSVLHNVAVFYDDDVPAGRLALAKLAGAARKAGSTTLRLYATLNAYGLEVDAGDNEAIARLDAELRELQIFMTPMASEALLPAQALRAAWDGRFEHAYGLLAPSAERLFDDDRTAYRWAEVAVYAAAAGRRSESAAAIRQCRETLRKVDPADRLTMRARAYLALAEILLAHDGRARSAIAELRTLARRGGPRFAALVEAVRALYLRWTTGWHGAPATAEALDNLERLDLGGVARFFGALPLPSSDQAKLGLLSDHEKRILTAVASGATSKEIGADLERSPQTVDVHIRSICRKLGCSGRRQAVALALREGLIGERRRPERSAG
ncbi:MAG TPA: LuxR C-terminal-related transcriptional regulator [Candidatus Elarobacter sp.]|nr:LuxR C-terminal-related transcriptional regulator [Candidatus Elarobacter sp.]